MSTYFSTILGFDSTHMWHRFKNFLVKNVCLRFIFQEILFKCFQPVLILQNVFFQRGDAKKAFLKELHDDIIITSAGVDISLIERIKVNIHHTPSPHIRPFAHLN